MDIEKSSRRQFLIGGAGTMIGMSLIGSRALAAPLEGEPRRGGNLRISVSDRTTSLNPFVQLNNTGYLLNELLYMGITRLGQDMKPKGDAVESWQANADLTEYTFVMRPNIVFHDGQKATAADAVASIEAVLDPRNACPAIHSIGSVKDVSAVDELQFKIRLNKRDADLPVALSHINLRLIPASILQSNPKVLETSVHGSGPFRLVRHESGRRTTVGRFDQYFSPKYPLLDSVELKIYPDAAAENAALRNGETDVMLLVSNSDYKRLASSENIKGRRQRSGGFMNIVLRTDTKPFDDLRVRQAISLCLDRDALRMMVLEGYGRAAYDNVISPEYRYGLPLTPFAPDYARARSLLAQAGYPEGIRITCYASNTPRERATLAVAFKELGKAAGIDVDVKVVPYDYYVANVWKKAGCYVALWNMMPTVDSMYTQFLTSQAPYNDSAYKNPEFDRLVESARSTPDGSERESMYRQAQQILMHDVPWLVPFYRDYLSAHGAHVNGYVTHPLIYPHFLERVWFAQNPRPSSS